jgi:hypothetical protein
VLPTSFQDNDPIRRPCIGNAFGKAGYSTGVTTGSAFNPADEVCNLDGQLGLVLAIPATDFIPKQQNDSSVSELQYPTNKCTNMVTGPTTTYLNCGPSSSGVHNGECPNGDSLFGGGCLIPVDNNSHNTALENGGNGGTSQCLNSGTTNAGSSVARISPTGYDGRIHNLHMYDGTGVAVGGLTTATPKYLVQVQQSGAAGGVAIPFAGGMGRIHAVATIFNEQNNANNNPTNLGCQLSSATDQIACLVGHDWFRHYHGRRARLRLLRGVGDAHGCDGRHLQLGRLLSTSQSIALALDSGRPGSPHQQRGRRGGGNC